MPSPEGAKAQSLLNEKGADGPPEGKYEFKLPDGFNMSEEAQGEVDAMFRGMGLSQANGQKLVDYYAARMAEASEAPFDMWSKTQKAWVDEIKADPVIGRKLPEVKSTVARAIDGLGDAKMAAEFRQAMDITGAGNNPAFIRAFYKLAQQVTEGSHVSGRGPSEAGQQAPDARPRTAAAALYPKLPQG